MTITTTSRILWCGSRAAKTATTATTTASRCPTSTTTTTAASALMHTLARRHHLPPTTMIAPSSFTPAAAGVRHMSSTLRAAPTWQKKPPSPIPSGGEILTNLTNENPYKDAVRFAWKNQKYTFHDLNFNSGAMATGFLETGLEPGDICVSWLPLHFAEHVMLQFACSKAGLILYWLDPAMAITDPDKARQALTNALHVSKANVFVTQDAGNDVSYMRLAQRVIPETRFFDYAEGFPFVTPRFPHLRFTIHTGFDYEQNEGFLLLREMLVPAEGMLESLTFPFTINAHSPLMGRFVLDAEGIPTGIEPPLTNQQVLEQKEWPTYASILRKEYIDIPGVGVIF